jgi:hypothetical protein
MLKDCTRICGTRADARSRERQAKKRSQGHDWLMRKFEDREMKGSRWLWLVCRLVGERSKGQAWKASNQGCENVKGYGGENRGEGTERQGSR